MYLHAYDAKIRISVSTKRALETQNEFAVVSLQITARQPAAAC